MAKKSIVVDASLARSAGESDHPHSFRARRFLTAVLAKCHSIVFTPALKAEWDNHQSAFARQWRVQMYARKKVISIALDQNEALRKGLLRTAFNAANPEEQASSEQAIQKDCHLIEAALHTDKIIASYDGKARRLFAHACLSVREIRSIMWIMHDPHVPIEDIVGWLENDAPDVQEWQLYIAAEP
jgi:hypothetical protein